MVRARFIEGPAGAGKTSETIRHIRSLLEQGIGPESILVLVPHLALGRSYQIAFAAPDWPGGAQPDIVTLGGLARRGLETFWPLVAAKAGFEHPEWEPIFLTIETSQYYMAGLVHSAVNSGVFDSVSLDPFRIMSQTLDNLGKAAINRFSLDEVVNRLIAAWGDRHSSRPPVYRASLGLAQEFRELCLKHSLVDFSLQIELFIGYLLSEPLYLDYLTQRYRHLVVDNLEENFPVAADFLGTVWQRLESVCLVFDTDAGYRVFLGADPAGMHQLAGWCDEVVRQDQPLGIPPVMASLAEELGAFLGADHRPPEQTTFDLRDVVTCESCRFYPEMIDWTVERITALVESGVSPHEIVVLAPFLGDSLRFSLVTRLNERGIKTVSHRPSRAVRDEPAARAILTLMALAHPEWEDHPPLFDVADALRQTIDELDPVRARLLAQIVYRQGELGPFEVIEPDVRQRVTYRAGEKYEHLRDWLIRYKPEAGGIPPDHFLSKLFGEVLSQPGYGFHTNLDAGRVIAELVESARKFRQTLYPRGVDHWPDVTYQYFSLVQAGLLGALYVSTWREEEQEAVFLSPAYTFLMRNRWVDYQFWLDIGSNYWWERLEQPLTHPYVLARNYPPDQVWTDDLEWDSRQDMLRRLVIGLARRCRKHIYAAISNLGEQGYEQRGPLLQVFQQLVQLHSGVEES